MDIYLLPRQLVDHRQVKLDYVGGMDYRQLGCLRLGCLLLLRDEPMELVQCNIDTLPLSVYRIDAECMSPSV